MGWVEHELVELKILINPNKSGERTIKLDFEENDEIYFRHDDKCTCGCCHPNRINTKPLTIKELFKIMRDKRHQIEEFDKKVEYIKIQNKTIKKNQKTINELMRQIKKLESTIKTIREVGDKDGKTD